MTKIAIIGGRGNGTVIASTIEDCRIAGDDIEFIGYVNDNEKEINGYPVLGPVREFDLKAYDLEVQFIFAMSNVKQAHDRHQMLEAMRIPADRFINVIHPTAVVSRQARLGRGIVVMPHSVVSPNVAIGNHSQLYAQSFVGHDSVVEEMVFVANNASVGGRVRIMTGAHIGSNASIRERLTIGEYAVVGLGSVVLNDVAPHEVHVGNPARKLNEI